MSHQPDRKMRLLSLVDAAILEVVFDEHVCDRAQSKPHVICVSGAGDMEMHFGPFLLDGLELVGYKLKALVVLLGPGVFRESYRDRLSLQSLLNSTQISYHRKLYFSKI